MINLNKLEQAEATKALSEMSNPLTDFIVSLDKELFYNELLIIVLKSFPSWGGDGRQPYAELLEILESNEQYELCQKLSVIYNS